jgi:hypothetical protein
MVLTVYPPAINLLLQIEVHGVKTVSKSLSDRRSTDRSHSRHAGVAAKAHYLALAGEPSATPAAIELSGSPEHRRFHHANLGRMQQYLRI